MLELSCASLPMNEKKTKMKTILSGMRNAGIPDVIPDSWVDSFTEEDLDYHLINYGESYLKIKFGD